MRLNVRFQDTDNTFGGRLYGVGDRIPVNFGEVQTSSYGSNDYNGLIHKPSINSVVLEGALTAHDLGLGSVYYDTTANWNLNPGLVAEEGAVYIYSDHEYVEDGAGNRTPVAGLKIGDGVSHLIDLPFVGDATTYLIVNHVANRSVHMTDAEREFWNNKVSIYVSHEDAEAIVISKTQYEKDGNILSNTVTGENNYG